MKKNLFILCASILLFTGCSSWFGSNSPTPLFTASISGTISTDGVIPVSFLSRSAIGNQPSGTKTYTCTVKDSADNTVSSAVFDTTYDSVNDVQYYSISGLPLYASPTTYKITIAYQAGGTDFLKSEEHTVTISEASSYFIENFILRPLFTGSGDIYLEVGLDSTTSSLITSASLVLTPLAGGSSETITGTAGTSSYTFEKNSVASGAYKASFSFYTTNASVTYLMYQFEEVVNVFQNCITNTWVKNNNNQEYLTVSGSTTSCLITQTCIANFVSSNFYVDKNTSATAKNGSYLEPFDSVEKAIKYVNTLTTDDTRTYTIHVRKIVGNINEGTHLINNKIDLARNITIECWNSAPGDGAGTTKFMLSDSFTDDYMFSIGSKNLTLKGEIYLDGNSKTADGIVSASSGEFEMNGGRIENFRTGILMATGNTSLVKLYGGLIQYNTDYGVKVNAGIIKVQGGIQVKNNPFGSTSRKNIYLSDSTVLSVDGSFASGAELRVTTASLPTSLTSDVTIATTYKISTYTNNYSTPPSTYIKSDTDNPVLLSGTSVVIKSNGGSLIPKYKDDILITCPNTLTRSPNAAKIFSFKASDAGTDVTTSSDTLFSFSVKCHGKSLSSSANTWTLNYSVEGHKSIILKNNLANEDIVIIPSVEYKGNSYSAEFTVKAIPYVENATVNGAVGTQSVSEIFKGTRSVSIGKLIASDHEVTQSEYETYCFYNGTWSPSDSNGLGANYPVYGVSWYSAIVYCNLRSIAEGLTPCYKIGTETDPTAWTDIVPGTGSNAGKYAGPTTNKDTWNGITFDTSANGWRLPTEAEWEYLARAALTEDYKFPGSNTVGDVAWYSVNADGHAHEVKTKSPNGLGLYDMYGNVCEWCWDWWSNTSTINSSTPATGPSNGSTKILRGYGYDDTYLHELSTRAGYEPQYSGRTTGFRVVRNGE